MKIEYYESDKIYYSVCGCSAVWWIDFCEDLKHQNKDTYDQVLKDKLEDEDFYHLFVSTFLVLSERLLLQLKVNEDRLGTYEFRVRGSRTIQERAESLMHLYNLLCEWNKKKLDKVIHDVLAECPPNDLYYTLKQLEDMKKLGFNLSIYVPKKWETEPENEIGNLTRQRGGDKVFNVVRVEDIFTYYMPKADEKDPMFFNAYESYLYEKVKKIYAERKR